MRQTAFGKGRGRVSMCMLRVAATVVVTLALNLMGAVETSSSSPGGGSTEGMATGPAEVVGTPQRLPDLEWQDYQATIKAFASMSAFVPLREELPTVKGHRVRYGLNAVMPVGRCNEVRNLSWALSVADGGLATLRVDGNANGTLSDDPVMSFPGGASGPRRIVQPLECAGARSDGSTTKFQAFWELARGPAGNELHTFVWRERRGVINVAGVRMAFALRTSQAMFSGRDALVGLDLNGDGTIEFGDADIETFAVSDGTVQIDGLEYALIVADDGGLIRLTPTGVKAAYRPLLIAGSKAPRVVLGTSDVEPRDEPLFLNFWSPACSFSKRLAPELRDASLQNRGVRFVSVTDVSMERAQVFTSEQGHDWTQVSGDEGRQLFKLFRISAVPTFYLIDRDGVILERGSTLDWPRIREAMGRLVATPASGASHPE